MAPRRPVPVKPERPVHSVEQKRQDIQRLQKRIDELHAFDPTVVTQRFNDPAVRSLEVSIDGTLAAVFGNDTVDYDRYSSAKDLDNGPIVLGSSSSWDGSQAYIDAHEARQYLAEGKARSVSLLQQAIREIEEEIEFAAPLRPGKATPGYQPASNKVFVVHGHDVAAREAMARFLHTLGIEAIILHEQPDQGLTIIEKFESYASQVGFAVVLLTPDDLAGIDSASRDPRARQNVVFELGYFAGKLGRGRSCLVRKGDLEMPSDLYGVIYTEMDVADGWKLKLVRELKAAGLKFDANKMWE